MPHIHPPEALPKRDGTFFVWAGNGYIQTQMKMSDVFREELRDYEATGSIPPCKIRFNHLGENVFLMLRSDEFYADSVFGAPPNSHLIEE